jgi:hypothetical protein
MVPIGAGVTVMLAEPLAETFPAVAKATMFADPDANPVTEASVPLPTTEAVEGVRLCHEMLTAPQFACSTLAVRLSVSSSPTLPLGGETVTAEMTQAGSVPPQAASTSMRPASALALPA